MLTLPIKCPSDPREWIILEFQGSIESKEVQKTGESIPIGTLSVSSKARPRSVSETLVVVAPFEICAKGFHAKEKRTPSWYRVTRFLSLLSASTAWKAIW